VTKKFGRRPWRGERMFRTVQRHTYFVIRLSRVLLHSPNHPPEMVFKNFLSSLRVLEENKKKRKKRLYPHFGYCFSPGTPLITAPRAFVHLVAEKKPVVVVVTTPDGRCDVAAAHQNLSLAARSTFLLLI